MPLTLHRFDTNTHEWAAGVLVSGVPTDWNTVGGNSGVVSTLDTDRRTLYLIAGRVRTRRGHTVLRSHTHTTYHHHYYYLFGSFKCNDTCVPIHVDLELDICTCGVDGLQPCARFTVLVLVACARAQGWWRVVNVTCTGVL